MTCANTEYYPNIKRIILSCLLIREVPNILLGEKGKLQNCIYIYIYI